MNAEQAQGARGHVIHYVTLWLDNTYGTCQWIENMVEKVKAVEAQDDWADTIGDNIKEMIMGQIEDGVADYTEETWVTGLLKDLLDAGDSTQWRQLGEHYAK